MLAIIEIGKFIISALVIGYIGLLSFLGLEDPMNVLEDTTFPAVVEERTLQVVIPPEYHPKNRRKN